MFVQSIIACKRILCRSIIVRVCQTKLNVNFFRLLRILLNLFFWKFRMMNYWLFQEFWTTFFLIPIVYFFVPHTNPAISYWSSPNVSASFADRVTSPYCVPKTKAFPKLVKNHTYLVFSSSNLQTKPAASCSILSMELNRYRSFFLANLISFF